MHTLGLSSLFFFFFFSVVTLLEKSLSVKATSLFAALTILVGTEVYRQYIGYPFLPVFEVIMIVFLTSLIVLERFIGKKERPIYEKKI